MANAQWSNATNATATAWDKNKARADLQRAATAYNSSSVTYNSVTTYYNGYNPTTTTAEGENPADWNTATSVGTTDFDSTITSFDDPTVPFNGLDGDPGNVWTRVSE